MVDSVAGWRDSEPKEARYDFVKVPRRRVRERDVLTFIALIVIAFVMLTGAVAFALVA